MCTREDLDTEKEPAVTIKSSPFFPHKQMEGSLFMETPRRTDEPVFLTPPTTGLKLGERAILDLGEPLKFDLSWSWEEFRDTTDTGDRTSSRPIPQIRASFWSESQQVEEQQLDIISRLVAFDAYEILHRILDSLTPFELCGFAAVCRSWHWAFKRDSGARQRRRMFLLTVRDENTKPPFTESRLESRGVSRRALASIENQIAEVEIARSEEFDRKSPFPHGVYGTYRKCHRCFGPALESAVEACCSWCGYSFCIGCFKPWSSQHSCQPTVGEIGMADKVTRRGKAAKYAIGSKQSKKRLKRL